MIYLGPGPSNNTGSTNLSGQQQGVRYPSSQQGFLPQGGYLPPQQHYQHHPHYPTPPPRAPYTPSMGQISNGVTPHHVAYHQAGPHTRFLS